MSKWLDRAKLVLAKTPTRPTANRDERNPDENLTSLLAVGHPDIFAKNTPQKTIVETKNENEEKIIENLKKKLHAQEKSFSSDAIQPDLPKPAIFTEPTQAEVNSVLCPFYRLVSKGKFSEKEADKLLDQLWAAQELKNWKTFRELLLFIEKIGGKH